jgi:plastocyanin
MHDLAYAAVFSAMLLSAGCTPGAATAPGGGNTPIASAVLIHVSLLKYTPAGSQFGTVAGYSPNVATVAVGSIVQFVNDDNFAHTATSVGSSGFPPGNPLSSMATTPQGNDLSSNAWSSGNLVGGGFSRGFTASVPGTYYYGCFYHYGTPMRGVIVVQ